MAQVYSSTTTWPQRWFELYHQVLKKKGLHYTFTEGRTAGRVQHTRSTLVKPYYKGYTLRFFCFANKKEGQSYVGVDYESRNWKGRVIVDNGVVSTQEYTHDAIKVGEVNVGDIYTVALGTEDQATFKMSFNETGDNILHLQDISDTYTYKLWEDSGNHTILSMHFYNASDSLPTPHLADRLYLNELILPVGAYGTYAVAYTGTTEAVIVTAIQDPDKMKFTFENNGRLNKDDLFHCIVRKTAYGLAVSVSFDPDHQFQPAVNPVIWLRCCFDYGSIQNAHIVSPW